jgi:hypothetical protein
MKVLLTLLSLVLRSFLSESKKNIVLFVLNRSQILFPRFAFSLSSPVLFVALCKRLLWKRKKSFLYV